MNKKSYNVSGVFLKLNDLLWKMAFLQKIRVVFYFIDSVLLLFIRKPKKNINSKKKVLLIYNLALGDCIMFLGVAKYFKEIYPSEKYEFTIACQPAFARLFKNDNIFDVVLPLDFFGSVINPKNRLKLFKKLRETHYDILLDPVGCETCTTNVFASRAASADEKIGIYDVNLPNSQTPKWIKKTVYSKVFDIDIPKIHLINYYGEYIKRLSNIEFNPTPATLPNMQLQLQLPNKFFIVFPTASMPTKRWSSENFAKVATHIYKQYHIPLLVCGTSHDKAAVDEFKSLLKDVETIDIIGQTNIPEFIEVISRASLVITNDTSAYHIAVAAKVPVGLICGGYTYDRYANYKYEQFGFENPLLISNYMPCFNCSNHCVYPNINVYPCIGNITSEYAIIKLDEFIQKRGI